MMKRKTVHDFLVEARSSLRRVDPLRAYEAMQEGTVLIDTRCDNERAKHGAIPGSLHIPLSVLEWRADPESGHNDPAIGDFGDGIILICADGYSSSLAARRLQELGFRQRHRLDRWFQSLERRRAPGRTKLQIFDAELTR